jgi:DNA (cytosine-5)-methyltransferase 1
VSRPRVLDLFCGAGGAAVGYHRAGCDVVGVDHRAQPRYPFEIIQADALELLETGIRTGMICGVWRLQDFDAIHASPPCQASSSLRAMWPEREYPELISPTREALKATRLPWVIENVVGAPLASALELDGTCGVELCGGSFALGVERGHLRRHRLFETTFPVPQLPCLHRGPAVGVYGHGGHTGKRRMLYRTEAAEAMGIDWMTRDEMTQAIPPAYTEYIGRFLLAEIDRLGSCTLARSAIADGH